MSLQNTGFTSDSDLKQLNNNYSQAYNIVTNVNNMNGYEGYIFGNSLNVFPYGFCSFAPDNVYAVTSNPGEGIMNTLVMGHIFPFKSDHIVTKAKQSNKIIKGDGGVLYSQNYALAAKLDSISYMLQDFKKTAISGEDTSALIYDILSTLTQILTDGQQALNTHTHLINGIATGSGSVTSDPTTTTWSSDVQFNTQKQYVGNGSQDQSKALINDNFEEYS